MAIASMVCGIIGFLGSIISVIRIFYLNELKNRVGLIFQWQIENQISISIIFLVISFILLILALIFGIIERKKGKTNKFYGMATTGFILGLIVFIIPALIIIFTVITNVITYKGTVQTIVDDSNSTYVESTPEFSFFELNPISARTLDGYSITIELTIGYDLNDQNANNELLNRRIQLNDFIRRYFLSKNSSEIVPDKEEFIKNEIKEMLNTRFLDNARIRFLLFNKLEINK